jgi:hypothetical protein
VRAVPQQPVTGPGSGTEIGSVRDWLTLLVEPRGVNDLQVRLA